MAAQSRLLPILIGSPPKARASRSTTAPRRSAHRRAWSSPPACSPPAGTSPASLRGAKDNPPPRRGALPPHQHPPSVARLLKTAGYPTAHFGKWHRGGGRDVIDAPKIEAYGFDEHASTWESPQ